MLRALRDAAGIDGPMDPAGVRARGGRHVQMQRLLAHLWGGNSLDWDDFCKVDSCRDYCEWSCMVNRPMWGTMGAESALLVFLKDETVTQVEQCVVTDVYDVVFGKYMICSVWCV